MRFIFSFFASLLIFAGCGNKNHFTTSSGIVCDVLREGNGDTPLPGSIVTVHYTGWLEDGKKFDSSLDRNEPFTFQVESRLVIPGWDQAIQTMKKGGKSKFSIPPELAYGANGMGEMIPANATLIFEIELLDIKSQN